VADFASACVRKSCVQKNCFVLIFMFVLSLNKK